MNRWRAYKYPDVKTFTVAGEGGSVASKIATMEIARLIAAAPEMLDYIVDTQPEDCSCEPEDNHQCRRCRAEEIIAKVDGKP